MKLATTAPAEKIFACYIDYIHAEKVIAITDPQKETLIAPIVAPLVQAQADVLPVYQLAVQQCQTVHQLLEKAYKKYEDNEAIETNIKRSHWFIEMLQYKMNLLDVSDTGKTTSEESVDGEVQYDELDLDTFHWDGGREYLDVHYAICKTLSQQQVAATPIIQALLVTCKYAMINYNEDEEYDKLAIVAKASCTIHALLSDDGVPTSNDLDRVIEELSTVYLEKENPDDENIDLLKSYQACLELHEYTVDGIYLEVAQLCAINLGNHAAEEGDKQGMLTYYSAAYQFGLECARPDVDVDGHYDWCELIELTDDFAEDFNNMEMYNEAIDFYKKSYDLTKKLCDESGEIDCDESQSLSDTASEIARIYLKLNKLDKALAYYYKADTDSEIDSEAASKINQLTAILHIEENPEVVHAYREHFYKLCKLSVDAIWLDLSEDDMYTYTIREGETVIGYCCITDWRCLKEYYIDYAYQSKMPVILKQMIDAGLVNKARLSTRYSPAIFLCLSEFATCDDELHSYVHSGKANAEGVALDMQLAREEDILKVIKFYLVLDDFYKEADVWADMINRGELYLYKENDDIIAVGECTTDDRLPESAAVNIVVAREYRQRGLGARLLAFLTDRAIEQGRHPIASFEDSYDVENVKKLAKKCGFERNGVFLEMGV